jgi:hypothetical protein
MRKMFYEWNKNGEWKQETNKVEIYEKEKNYDN